MSHIPVNGIRFHVQQSNEFCQDSIIMLHGLGYGSLAVWYFKIAPVLSKNFRIVMYDHKSHGLSERTKNGYDLDNMSRDMEELMKILNIGKTSIVGFSYGALIALYFASRFPEKVDKIALIEAPDPGDKNEAAFEYASKNKIRISDEMRDILFPEHILEISGKGKRHIKKQNDNFEFLVNESTLVKDIHELPSFEQWETNKIFHPVLAIYGNASICRPMAAKLPGQIKNIRIKYFDGDHGILTKYSAEIAVELENFFLE